MPTPRSRDSRRLLDLGDVWRGSQRQAGPHRDHLYYISTTSYCGLVATIEDWNIGGGPTGSVYDFAEDIDGNGTSLAPDVGTPSNSDLLFSQFDCLAQDSDNYEIDSVNTVTPTAQPQAALGTRAVERGDRAPRVVTGALTEAIQAPRDHFPPLGDADQCQVLRSPHGCKTLVGS